MNKLQLLKHRLKVSWHAWRRGAYVITTEIDGKRYVSIVCWGFGYVRWNRCFEVVNEVSTNGRKPKEWKPQFKHVSGESK